MTPMNADGVLRANSVQPFGDRLPEHIMLRQGMTASASSGQLHDAIE